MASVIPATADSGSGFPPVPTCFPGLGPCQETDHFGEFAFLATPLPGCATLTEIAFIDTKGNGVQHITVNAAQDAWETFTMVGPTTVVQGTAQLDAMGNPIPGTFTADPNAPTFSGHLQQWFGFQLNHSNASTSGTANFQGTSSTGASVILHFNLHFNSTATAPTILNMNSAHFDVSCS